jgi:hypothetical protein
MTKQQKINLLTSAFCKYFYLFTSGLCIANAFILVDLLFCKHPAHDHSVDIVVCIINTLFALYWIPLYFKECDTYRKLKTQYSGEEEIIDV